MRRWRGVLAAVIGLVSALLLGCPSPQAPEATEFRVPVRVVDVETGDVEDQIVVTGTLRVARVVTLRVETPGVLEIGTSPSGRTLGEGDSVRAGQIIAVITGEEARVSARTEATRQRLEATSRDYEAKKRLFEEGLISEQELRDAEARLADAQLEADRSQLAQTQTQLVTPIDGVILR
ncbi:MAG: hypothetical protein JSV80_09395, partial [Acidobacteriota bacterium]